MSFHEVRLPARLAFGSTGGVERRTEVVTLASGFERRSTPWAHGRRRYLIGAGVRSLDDVAALVAFFEARRGLADRPWSPAHLTLEVGEGGDLILRWVRRARLGGDGWGGEPPLSEEQETYRVEILDGEAVVRTVEVTSPFLTWTSAQQTDDFPGGVPDPVTFRVAQGSAVFGWGATTTRSLWR
jgi:hypothetical protein